MYAKKLTINKGVDNVLLFEFINQDEKPVNISGSEMVFRIVDQSGTEMLLEKTMVILNAQYGRAKVTINPQDLATIRAQPVGYSITRKSGNLTEAVFTDAQAGARAPADIVDSVYAEFIPSPLITIPTTELSAQSGSVGSSSTTYPDWARQAGQPINNYAPLQNQEFYSSFFEPYSPVTTIQMDLVGYTGTIKVQAAENYQSPWYDITESYQYYNRTETIHLNVFGWHPIMRLALNNSIWTTGVNGDTFGAPAQATATVVNGTVTEILVTQPGQGYQAPPLVEIIGNGAGARAVATLAGNEVGAITVVNGGSGYRPVPPTMIEATVMISTGRLENIIYR